MIFAVIFDQFNVSLLYKYIHFILFFNLTDPKILNSSVIAYINIWKL